MSKSRISPLSASARVTHRPRAAEVAWIEHLDGEQFVMGADGPQWPVPADRSEEVTDHHGQPVPPLWCRSASIAPLRSPRTPAWLRVVVATAFSRARACALPRPRGPARFCHRWR